MSEPDGNDNAFEAFVAITAIILGAIIVALSKGWIGG